MYPNWGSYISIIDVELMDGMRELLLNVTNADVEMHYVILKKRSESDHEVIRSTGVRSQ